MSLKCIHKKVNIEIWKKIDGFVGKYRIGIIIVL